MNRPYLGEFEELPLLTVAMLNGQAYGVSILEEIEKQTGRTVSLSAIHAPLQRLEERGYLRSKMDGATSEHGGRRKRFFTVTRGGTRAQEDIHHTRNHLWNQIPKIYLACFLGSILTAKPHQLHCRSCIRVETSNHDSTFCVHSQKSRFHGLSVPSANRYRPVFVSVP